MTGESGYKTTGVPNVAPVACGAVLAAGLGAVTPSSPSYYLDQHIEGARGDSVAEFSESYSYTMSAANRMQEALVSLLTRYCRSNWNGYGESPISWASWNYVKEFVSTLPTWVQEADITVDADGDISLEWYRSKTDYLELVFGASGCVHCFMQTKSSKRSDLFKEDVRVKVMNCIAEFENA